MSVLSILSSPAAIWGATAGLIAVVQEYQYRALQGEWWTNLYIHLPLQMALSYAIYRLVTMPQTSLLDAFVVFAFWTTALRVMVTVLVLGDPVKGGTWFALALLIMARIAQTFWGR